MSLDIKVDSLVYKLDEEYVITKIIDFNYVFAQNTTTLETVRLNINDLSSKPIDKKENNTYEDLSHIPEKRLEEARERYEAIKPLIGTRSRKEIEKKALDLGVSPTTIYNWLRAYNSTGQLSSLAFLKIKGGKGKSRLSKEQDGLINLVIKEYYLTELKPSIPRVYEILIEKCKNSKTEVPAISTLRRRIQQLSERQVLRKREGKKAVEKFELNVGNYPDGLYPLHVLQIDHTRADVILVDDEYREELGRPWVTMAIDIYSRMVTGFYVSFEAPGYFATGQTLYNSIIPKDKLKEKYKFKSEWPVWGIPNMIHMDNAKEFRGIDLQRVCSEYGINIVWRPVGKARFGGHIERLLGTLSGYIHTLEGTTFSNISMRKEYASHKKAVMTLNEFEEWLTVLIADVYHNKIHSQINMSPLQKYKEGIFGTATQPPRGLPRRVEDEQFLYLNLLPKVERTIQKYGIQIDGIDYFSEVLNSWVDSYEYIRGKKMKKLFTIRRDPRDISQVWFYNPKFNKYYLIPYRNTRLPKVSLWEYRAAQNYLKKLENREYKEEEVFEALARLRTLALEAKSKTKAQKKLINRVSNVKKAGKTNTHQPVESKQEQEVDGFPESWLDTENLTPFENIEDSEPQEEVEQKSPLNQNDDSPL